MDFLKSLLHFLVSNSKFPSYQAERRIDIFINFFLEEILSSYLGQEVLFVAPEFPLKKEESNRSTKLDYLCMYDTGNEKRVVYVELKTLKKSFNEIQKNIYLKYSWKEAFDGLKTIIINGSMTCQEREKYYNLFTVLVNRGLIVKRSCDKSNNVIDPINCSDGGKSSRAFKTLVSEYEAIDVVTELLYIAPEKISREIKTLTFKELSKMEIDTLYKKEWKIIQEELFSNII
jgi:hypothetical protein